MGPSRAEMNESHLCGPGQRGAGNETATCWDNRSPGNVCKTPVSQAVAWTATHKTIQLTQLYFNPQEKPTNSTDICKYSYIFSLMLRLFFLCISLPMYREHTLQKDITWSESAFCHFRLQGASSTTGEAHV